MENIDEMDDYIQKIVKATLEAASKIYIEYLGENKNKKDIFNIELINNAFEHERFDLVNMLLEKLNETKDAYNLFIEKFNFNYVHIMSNEIIERLQKYINNKSIYFVNELNKDKYKELCDKLRKQKKQNNNNKQTSKNDTLNKKTIKNNIISQSKESKNVRNIDFEGALSIVQKSFHKLKQKNNDLETENNKLSKEKENLSSKIENYKKEMCEIRKEINDKDITIKNNNDKISNIENKIISLNKELEEYKKANEDLQKDKEYLKLCYIRKLSENLKTNYSDYKKYSKNANIEQMQILLDNVFDTLQHNGIEFD